MDAGLLAFLVVKGGLLVLFFVMWRQAKRAADEARAEQALAKAKASDQAAAPEVQRDAA